MSVLSSIHLKLFCLICALVFLCVIMESLNQWTPINWWKLIQRSQNRIIIQWFQSLLLMQTSVNLSTYLSKN